METSSSASAAPPAEAKVAAPTALVMERPDGRSAMLTARSQGQRVEDLSQRSETSQTWAEADGSWSTELHTSQQRVRDAAGAWQKVDLSLVASADGGVGPRVHGGGLRFPKHGRNGEVRLSQGAGRTVSIGMPGDLPEPVIDGARARYAEVMPGVDMVLDALRSGFEQSWIIKDRAAVPAAGMSWSLPLKTKGLDVRPEADGSVSFVDNKGKVVSRIPAAYAFDARVDTAAQTDSSYSAVKLSVVTKNPGQAVLVVTPDVAWLKGPATVFPVTVDPSYLSAGPLLSTFDTYIQQGQTTDFSGATELKIGQWAAGQNTRSYLNFNLSTLKGKHIVGANLKLYETFAGTTSANQWDAHYVTATAASSWNWGNQSYWDTNIAATSVETKGGGSGVNGPAWVEMNVTNLAQRMADDSLSVNSLGLWAHTETGTSSTKKFRSTETTSDPYLTVTYNSIPNGPSSVRPTSPRVDSFVNDSTPVVAAAVSDRDGNNVNATIQIHSGPAYDASTLKAECVSAYVASGATASCTIPSGSALPNGHYFIRAKAKDTWQDGPWIAGAQFDVAGTAPNVPVITCPSVSNGSWSGTVPGAKVSCTISAAQAGAFPPAQIKYSIDGQPSQFKSITPSSNPAVANTTVEVNNVKGGHRIAAWAISPSAIPSLLSSYGFGFGDVALDAPLMDPAVVTTSTVTVQASGPPAGGGTPTAELQWRLPNGQDAATGWNTATAIPVTTDAATGGVIAAGTWDTTQATHDTAANLDLDARVAATIELQICLNYSGATQCTWTTQQARVLRVPHAFGDGFPTAEAGPGQVALWTGEFTTTATDVTVPGYTGTLSVSRTHSTYAGPANPAAAVFGPGWTASLDGTDDGGLAGSQLYDNTLIDGTLVLADSEGTPMVFAPGGDPVRRGGANLTAGAWAGVDDDTIDAGINATVTSTGSATVVAVTEPDGTVTTFKPSTAPASNVAGVFAPDAVSQPGSGTTSYTRDAQGRVTRILAPLPTGLTSSNCPGTGTLQAGCRAIDITYATTTTAVTGTPGDFAGQVKQINLNIWNPSKTGGAGMDSIAVATYKYDTAGRMTSVTDPRTNLTTAYAYDASNRLTTLTPAGQAAFTINYAGTPVKFKNVTRPNPATAGGGTATLASVVYGIPLSGTNLPDLSASGVAAWRQTAAPTYAAAVFGQDHPVATIDPAGISSSDWQWADIQATDARGYVLNTASYGAGDWQRTATDYDPITHMVIETLDASDIDRILTAGADPDTVGTVTVYNTATNGPVNTTPGTVVTDVYETSREMTLADGSIVQGRPHTHTTYDEGSPNSGTNPDTGLGWALPTTATGTVSSALIANGDLTAEPADVSKTGYGPDATSWKLGQPVTQTQVVDGGSGDITKAAGYDAEGRVIAQQQPMSNGSDAGTRKTVYYTVAPNGTFPECGSKPEWAGAVCKTYFAAQAGGHDLITTTYSGYNLYLTPATITETANGATRTTTTTFDSAGRPSKSSTTATGLTGSTAVNGTEIEYDTTTGQPFKQWALNSSGARTGDAIITGYDTWGRALTYSPASGETTTTTFNTSGQVTSIADPSGTKTFGYGNDAAGLVEHRGMPTSVAIGGGPSGDLTFTGAYNRDGALYLETLPGALIQRTEYDTAGDQVGLTYSGQITTVNPDGSSTVDPDGAWLGWSIDRDAKGRITRENTPAAGGYVTGGIDPNVTIAAAPYDRSYTYDKADRLTRVEDRTAAAGAGVDPVTGEPVGATCLTRAYSFDKNGNRLWLATSPAAGDGSCQTSTGTTTRSWSWDSGDRTTNTGNVFDAFGRQTTLPATDAPKSANGNVTLGYYDTDAIKSIAQNGVTTSWTLDQAQRRAVETVGTKTTTRHYTDDGDNPAYVDVTESGTTTRTRYETSLGGDLGLSVSSGATTTAQVTLVDPHGDVVATADVTATGTAAVGIAGWVDQDEYGNPVPAGSAASVTKGVGYGWVGAKQRATLDTGLLLMGARVYDPATGQFTSTDPVYGGNPTAYAYPTDPINNHDVSGQCPWCAVVIACARFCVPAGQAIQRFGNWAQRSIASSSGSGWRPLKRHCWANSFDGDTPILMADGSLAQIEDVEVGDLVWATNPETGEAGARPVVDLIRHGGPHAMVKIQFADGTTIDATDGHPFWAFGGGSLITGGWVDARDLRAGSRLASANGATVTVSSVKASIRTLTAYNLTIAEFHTYFAGPDPVLVHNASCPVHGHAPQGSGKSNKGRHDDGIRRKQNDQKNSNNPNKRRPQCNHQWHCPR